MSDEPYILDPPEGFVRIVHPELPDHWSDVPLASLDVYQARGWDVEKDDEKPAPAEQPARKPAARRKSTRKSTKPDAKASDTKEP